MTDEPIHDDIDELARAIEQQITDGEEFLADAPEFDSKYRRMEEAQVDTGSLFS